MNGKFVVCGYYFKGDGLSDVILGGYSKDTLHYAGQVEMPLSDNAFRHVAATDSVGKSRYCERFPEFPGADWLKPELVCEVEYGQLIPGSGLTNADFKGLCGAVPPESCCLF